jgi:hypothetical protein
MWSRTQRQHNVRSFSKKLNGLTQPYRDKFGGRLSGSCSFNLCNQADDARFEHQITYIYVNVYNILIVKVNLLFVFRKYKYWVNPKYSHSHLSRLGNFLHIINPALQWLIPILCLLPSHVLHVKHHCYILELFPLSLRIKRTNRMFQKQTVFVSRWIWKQFACRTSDDGKSCSTYHWCFTFGNIVKELHSSWSSCLSKHYITSAAETRLLFSTNKLTLCLVLHVVISVIFSS